MRMRLIGTGHVGHWLNWRLLGIRLLELVTHRWLHATGSHHVSLIGRLAHHLACLLTTGIAHHHLRIGHAIGSGRRRSRHHSHRRTMWRSGARNSHLFHLLETCVGRVEERRVSRCTVRLLHELWCLLVARIVLSVVHHRHLVHVRRLTVGRMHTLLSGHVHLTICVIGHVWMIRSRVGTYHLTRLLIGG